MLTGHETALMNQFRCSKKMLLISIAFFIPLIITLSLLAGEQLRTIKFSQNEPLGVESIVPVRQLVQHFPEHRGMTSAYLSSNENFRVKTLETKKQIANEIPLIDRVDRHLGQQLDTTTQWNNFKATWNQSESVSFDEPAKDVFDKYTQLFAKALALVKHVSDKSNLTLNLELDNFYIKEAIVNLLLQIVENLGQSIATVKVIYF
jgi:hypothetical protein